MFRLTNSPMIRCYNVLLCLLDYSVIAHYNSYEIHQQGIVC